MLFLRRSFAHALQDVTRGNRAVRTHVIGFGIGHLAEHRLADLHRLVEVFAFYAPGTVVAGAALDQRYLGAGQLQRVTRLVADVLHPLVTRHVIRHLAQRRGEIGVQQAIEVARHQVFERVPHRFLHRLHVCVMREHQRQFLLVHQRARWHRGQDRVASLGELGQMRNVDFHQLFHRFQITQFQLGHAAAGFLFHHHRRNFIVRQQLQQIVADARLVVVHITGGIDRHLARCTLASLHLKPALRFGSGAESGAVVLRQFAVGVDMQHAVDQLADRLALQAGVHHLHHHGDRRELAHRVGRRQQLVAERRPALLEFDRLGTQHDVRKIDVPRMRRHIRAFGHVAEIAQIALIDHLHVVGLGDTIHFHRRRLVHQIEQRRKRGAQRHAAATAMAGVKYTLHLMVEFFFVVKIRIFPIQRVTGRGFEIAFAYAHANSNLDLV